MRCPGCEDVAPGELRVLCERCSAFLRESQIPPTVTLPRADLEKVRNALSASVGTHGEPCQAGCDVVSDGHAALRLLDRALGWGISD